MRAPAPASSLCRQRAGGPFPFLVLRQRFPDVAAHTAFHTSVLLPCCSFLTLCCVCGRKTHHRDVVQQRLLVVAIMPPHQEGKSFFQTSCARRAVERVISSLMNSHHFLSDPWYSQWWDLIHLRLYIVSFPASFSPTACFDLTPCGQAGYYQPGKLRGSWYWWAHIYE